MLGALIRTVGHLAYTYPAIPQDTPRSGPFGRLKIALVADSFTSVSLAAECRIRCMTPRNYAAVLRDWRPDLVFVESAFHGAQGEWRYMLAKQPRYINWYRPRAIFDLARRSRDLGIPTVFWNKDDGAFFDTFIDVARKFQYVFTTDNCCLPRYREELPPGSTADVLAMPYQPAFHSFSGFSFQKNEACFVGSYYRYILNGRRQFLDMIFDVCKSIAMPLHIYDRNSHRMSHFFEFRFPKDAGLHMHNQLPYTETGTVYKRYAVSLNVNSVTNSETMCSRRLLEILACGGILVTNNSPVVERQFRNFCHVVQDASQAQEVLARLAAGPGPGDKERAAAGAVYVRSHHTWQHRLEQLADTVNF